MIEIYRNLFWDTESIAIEDIPTVQDMFKAADTKILRAEIYALIKRARFSENKLTKEQRTRLKALIKKALKQMRELKVEPSNEWICFSNRYLNAYRRPYILELEIEPAFVNTADLHLAVEACNNGFDSYLEKTKRSPKIPETYEFRYASWHDFLSARIWLKGCMNAKERYLTLASIFYEMTVYGFDKKSHDKRVKKELRAMDAAFKELESGESGRFSSAAIWQEIFEEVETGDPGNYGLAAEKAWSFGDADDIAWHCMADIAPYCNYLFAKQVAELAGVLTGAA